MKIRDLKYNGCVITLCKDLYFSQKNKIWLPFYMLHVFYHVNYLFINTGESNYFL